MPTIIRPSFAPFAEESPWLRTTRRRQYSRCRHGGLKQRRYDTNQTFTILVLTADFPNSNSRSLHSKGPNSPNATTLISPLTIATSEAFQLQVHLNTGLFSRHSRTRSFLIILEKWYRWYGVLTLCLFLCPESSSSDFRRFGYSRDYSQRSKGSLRS